MKPQNFVWNFEIFMDHLKFIHELLRDLLSIHKGLLSITRCDFNIYFTTNKNNRQLCFESLETIPDDHCTFLLVFLNSTITLMLFDRRLEK